MLHPLTTGLGHHSVLVESKRLETSPRERFSGPVIRHSPSQHWHQYFQSSLVWCPLVFAPGQTFIAQVREGESGSRFSEIERVM